MMKKGFTLIEIIAALVILAIIVAIVTPIVFKLVDKADNKSNHISVDNYGHAIELALAQYELEHGDYPDTIDNLNVKYSGAKVQCNITKIRSDGSIFLSECYVDGDKVTDKKTYDNYYQYGKSDRVYIDMYGDELNSIVSEYYSENNEYPEDLNLLKTTYSNYIRCNTKEIHSGKVFLSNCKVNNDDVIDVNNSDGYYHYGYEIGTQLLVSKANSASVNSYSSSNKNEMFVFEHEATEQTPQLTDYRYIGSVPNNYVTFNGNEIWRIIGVFNVENEDGNYTTKIKIIRNDKLENPMPFSSQNSNKWEISGMYDYLNNDYYNSIDDVDRNLISNSKYYLGGISNTNSTGDSIYSAERSNTVYTGRSTNYYNKIALMYVSDYVYTYSRGVEIECFNDISKCYKSDSYYNSSAKGYPKYGWLYFDNYSDFTITGYATNRSNIWLRSSSGNIGYSSASSNFYVRPVLYLNENVCIKNGDGTIDNPYHLTM